MNSKSSIYIFNNAILSEKGMSGSDRRVVHWSNIFKKRELDVAIITSRFGKSRFRGKGFKLIITGGVDFRKVGIMKASFLQIILGLRKSNKLSLKKEDIIYSSSDLPGDFFPAFLAKIKNRNCKFFCGLHLVAPNPFKGFKKGYQQGFSLPSFSGIFYFLIQRLTICLLKKLSNFVMVSNHLDREFLLKRGFSKDQVIVTYGAVDKNLIPKGKIKKEFDACWVGRLHSQKGIEDIYLIWLEVVKKLPKAKLLIIGESNLEEDFQKRSCLSELKSNIYFSGYLGGKELFKAIKKSNIMLCPSYYESFGMVIAEGMSCGLPVVAYSLPVYEKIYGANILKSEIGNWKKFAESVIKLIEDKKKRLYFSDKSIKVAASFTWEKTAKEILKTLNLK